MTRINLPSPFDVEQEQRIFEIVEHLIAQRASQGHECCSPRSAAADAASPPAAQQPEVGEAPPDDPRRGWQWTELERDAMRQMADAGAGTAPLGFNRIPAVDVLVTSNKGLLAARVRDQFKPHTWGPTGDILERLVLAAIDGYAIALKARHDARVTELIAANNAEVERRVLLVEQILRGTRAS